MEVIYTHNTVSVTELKRNFSNILDLAEDNPVAVLNHNKPEAYLLSAKLYAKILEQLEELEDIKLMHERTNGSFVDVKKNDL